MAMFNSYVGLPEGKWWLMDERFRDYMNKTMSIGDPWTESHSQLVNMLRGDSKMSIPSGNLT